MRRRDAEECRPVHRAAERAEVIEALRNRST